MECSDDFVHDNKLVFDTILNRIDSRHFSRLWSFYRDFFLNDAQCIQFLYDCVKKEPVSTEQLYYTGMGFDIYGNLDNKAAFDETVFIPKRMLNVVEQTVSAARDIGQLRYRNDIIKLIYLRSCVESLQQLKGMQGSKKDLWFSFFDNYTNEADKAYILDRFEAIDRDLSNPFQVFIGVLNEYRNGAVHDGRFAELCFNNNDNRDECPIICDVKIDLVRFSRKNKVHFCFNSKLCYADFERVFVRTCISFIDEYVHKYAIMGS